MPTDANFYGVILVIGIQFCLLIYNAVFHHYREKTLMRHVDDLQNWLMARTFQEYRDGRISLEAVTRAQQQLRDELENDKTEMEESDRLPVY